MKERGTRRYSDRERDVEKSKFLNEDIAFIFLQFSFYRKVRAHLCRTPKTERERKKNKQNSYQSQPLDSLRATVIQRIADA